MCDATVYIEYILLFLIFESVCLFCIYDFFSLNYLYIYINMLSKYKVKRLKTKFSKDTF